MLNTPCYEYSSDLIRMPYRNTFNRDHAFYMVLFHELIHWSGGSRRLNRRRNYAIPPFEAYCLEEFVAQQGSALLQGHFHMPTDSFDLDYFSAYSDSGDEAEKMLTIAHDLAKRAVEYLLNLSDRNARIA